MSYVIRNGIHYLGKRSSYCDEWHFRYAKKFPTLTAAKAEVGNIEGWSFKFREVLEVSWALRWFKEGVGEDYFDGTAGHPGKVNTRADAILYASAKEARASLGDWAGYSDGFGLKVVRFLRRVK